MANLGVICSKVPLLLRLMCRVAALFLVFSFTTSLPAASAEGDAYLIEISGPIGPGIADHVARGFKEAAAANAPLVILRIDTPGGLVSSTRDIIKTILAQRRPVVGFVAPSGSRAASAGAYILLACNVAVMAPGTNVGSATPVMMGGAPGSPTPPSEKSEYPDLTDKIINDAKAYMRAIAEMRGRPSEVAETFVSEALNFTATEAKENGLIDLTASNLRDMLKQLDGHSIQSDGQSEILKTDLMDVVVFERTWRDDLLVFITNPNIAYLLLMVGIYGLIFEFSNPGMMAPGIIGGICLVLGLYALQMLPINFAGLALIGIGVALMVAEAFIPSFGVLGLGGIVSFLFGSVMLIDSDVPELQISPVLIGTVSLTTAGLFLFVLTFAVRAWRRPAVSGNAAMLHSSARILSWKQGQGTVQVHGEVWSAVGDFNGKLGEKVEIAAIDGLTLTVVRPSAKYLEETEDDA